MFKKGHKPHNKGDIYVRANYREMPDDDMPERKMMMRSSNPFRIDITGHDLMRSKNTLRSDRVDLF